jgi:hypothetical protein
MRTTIRLLSIFAFVIYATAADASQCAAATQKGSRCKRNASPGSSYCWQHGGTTKAERQEIANRATEQASAEELNAGKVAAKKRAADGQAEVEAARRAEERKQAAEKAARQQAEIAAREAKDETERMEKALVFVLNDEREVIAQRYMEAKEEWVVQDVNKKWHGIKKVDIKEIRWLADGKKYEPAAKTAP